MGEEYNPSPEGNPSFLARRNWFQTQLVRLIGRNTPKCRQVVRILSQGMDKKLSLKTRLQLRVHYLICDWCRRYEQQLHFLRDAARQFPEKGCDGADPKAKLADSAKERIRQKLKAADKPPDS
ncbi:MAG: zf-HC2 domain-containing protein [Candidatus Methylacidiphilales bacterium]